MLIQTIIFDIESCLKRLEDLPIDKVAYSIVGKTWGREEDIMDFIDNYPKLIKVADLAADIELLQEDSAYRRELWQKLLINFEALKKQVAQENADKAK